MAKHSMRIVIAQVDFLVGDIEANSQRIVELSIAAAQDKQADLIVFPELAITSYPPEDLLLRPALYVRVKQALASICSQLASIPIAVIVGYPAQQETQRFNRLAWISAGEIKLTYDKQRLPNYGVFDEKRYFQPGSSTEVIQWQGQKIGLLICEDLWHRQPALDSAAAKAQLIITINASPFDYQKAQLREEIVEKRVAECKIPIIYTNLVGGQDQLVFDGGSFAVNPTPTGATTIWHSEFFKESITTLIFDGQSLKPEQAHIFSAPSFAEKIYQALVLGTRDYLRKNKFPGALIGLSGGIDSALALVITVDAIGADNVSAIMMPSQFTRDISLEDARSLADQLQVDYQVIPIEKPFTDFLALIKADPNPDHWDATEENIQARCRGIILMALSNKTGKIVIACGNKSELAVGYSTLYGDMVGGFSVIKDVSKTLVYRLAEHYNEKTPLIPARIIEREPSAELSPNQVDQDSLPPYPVLDELLEKYIEQDLSPQQIIEAGFSKKTVHEVIEKIIRNEYKRRQAPPGVKISSRAFGKDRRYPITSGYFNHKNGDLPNL